MKACTFLTLAFPLAWGCSSGGSGGGSGGSGHFAPECQEPTGAYNATYTTLSGNCGDVPAQVIVFDGSTECTVSYQSATFDGTSCHWEGKEVCPNAQGTYVIDVTADRSQINGTFTVTVPNKCTGTYQLSATKA